MDPLILQILALAFSLLFLLAAVHKLSDPRRFLATLDNYRLLPAALLAPAGVAIIALEIFLGIAWLFAWRLPLTGTLSAALLILYAGGMAINLLRGRRHISCGCSFGLGERRESQLSGMLLLRNASMAAAALLALLPASNRELTRLDDLTLGAALVAIVLFSGAANQLINNSGAINTWRRPDA